MKFLHTKIINFSSSFYIISSSQNRTRDCFCLRRNFFQEIDDIPCRPVKQFFSSSPSMYVNFISCWSNKIFFNISVCHNFISSLCSFFVAQKVSIWRDSKSKEDDVTEKRVTVDAFFFGRPSNKFSFLIFRSRLWNEILRTMIL